MAERHDGLSASGADASIASRRFVAAMAAVLMVAAMHSTAIAQQVAVLVGGSPITTYDIEQRSKLIQLSTHKTPTRQEVIEELINDKLKYQEAKRYNMEASEAEVERAVTNMGARTRMSLAQFSQMLAAGGVRVDTIKSRIRSEISWAQLVRARFASSFEIDEKEIKAALETKKQDGNAAAENAVGYDYSLRPILFIVPKGSPAPVVEARMREAEGLRTRFQNCDEGIAFTRGLKDVAVRDPVARTSADLAPALREVLDNTGVGHLTKPEVTQQGVELFALCARKETTADTPEKRGVREQIFSSKFEMQSKRYLADVRRQSMIEFK
jgi:peptidyl-prolyl cis-trans isomerase SurA